MHGHMGEGCFPEKKKFCKDANQTENFRGVKSTINPINKSNRFKKTFLWPVVLPF